MLVVVFSLLGAFFFACRSVVVKVGLQESDPASATLITSVINAVSLWVLTILFVPFDTFVHPGVIYLAVAGLFAPCLARVFLYTGIEKVGVSVAEPINSTAPIFAAIGAVLLLHERVTSSIAVATILTVLGVVMLSVSSGSARRPTEMQWKKKGVLFSLLAALFYGVSRVFRKMGMIPEASPVGGATVIATTSLLFFGLLLPLIQRKRKIVVHKKSFFFFSIGGICGSLAMICILTALKWGDVVIVSPLTGTTLPLFVLCLTYVFLRKLERITLRTVVGASSIVAGVLILTSVS